MSTITWSAHSQISIRSAVNGFVIEVYNPSPHGPDASQQTYIAETHHDVLDIIDNLLRPEGPADKES